MISSYLMVLISFFSFCSAFVMKHMAVLRSHRMELIPFSNNICCKCMEINEAKLRLLSREQKRLQCRSLASFFICTNVELVAMGPLSNLALTHSTSSAHNH